MAVCKNPTCDRDVLIGEHSFGNASGGKTYCCRDCQVAMRTVSKGKPLGDIWVEMSTWHLLKEQAEEQGMTVKEYVKFVIEMEVAL